MAWNKKNWVWENFGTEKVRGVIKFSVWKSFWAEKIVCLKNFGATQPAMQQHSLKLWTAQNPAQPATPQSLQLCTDCNAEQPALLHSLQHCSTAYNTAAQPAMPHSL